MTQVPTRAVALVAHLAAAKLAVALVANLAVAGVLSASEVRSKHGIDALFIIYSGLPIFSRHPNVFVAFCRT